jgi:hypothetical protein
MTPFEGLQLPLFDPKDPEMWKQFRMGAGKATEGINKMPFVFGGGGGEGSKYGDLADWTKEDNFQALYGGGAYPNGGGGGVAGGTMGGGVNSSSGGLPGPFAFSGGGGEMPGNLTRYGLFSGRDAFGNPIGNTPLTVDWSGISYPIPSWASSQAANMTGLSAYHQAGVNPPPGLIQTTNDIAMGLFTNPPPGGRKG